MNKSETDYTKILLKTQKSYLESQNKLIGVLTQMESSLAELNDSNVLHTRNEESRYQTIEKLAVAIESRAKVMNTAFLLLAIAIVILAGAEKALQFISI